MIPGESPIDLPPEVRREVGGLIDDLIAAGSRVRNASYSSESFGDWSVDVALRGYEFRLVRDRGQYRFDAVNWELPSGELWPAFDHISAFERAVRTWVAAVARG